MRARLGVTALAIVAALWAVLASKHLFPYLSYNNDEPVYLSQAETLLEGRFSDPKDGLSPFFIKWFQAERGDQLVYKYTPVYAIWLAFCRLLFGSFRGALALTAGLNVLLFFGLAREVGTGRRPALWATTFFVVSPFFLSSSTLYLSYSTFLLLTMAFGLRFLRAIRLESDATMASAGAILGVAFFARPYDAVLLAAAFLLPHFLPASRPRYQRLLWLLVGFLPVSAFIPLYNYSQMGTPFSFPFSIDPSDTLGFGLKRLHPRGEYITYDLSNAGLGLLVHYWQCLFWTFGGPILFLLMAHFGVFRRPSRAEVSLLLLCFLFPAGYFFFWGSFHNVWGRGLNILGPNYYLPLIVPICLLGTRHLLVLTHRKVVLKGVFAVLMLVPTAFCFGNFISMNAKATADLKEIYRPIEKANLASSIVMVPPVWGPYLLHPFAYLRNTPETRAKGTLFAVDLEMENFKLWDQFPNHNLYRFQFFDWKERTFSELISFKRTTVRHWAFQIHVENPTDRRKVSLTVKNGDSLRILLLDQNSRNGETYFLECEVNPRRQLVIRRNGKRLVEPITLEANSALDIEAQFEHLPTQYEPIYFGLRFLFRPAANGFEVVEPPERITNYAGTNQSVMTSSLRSPPF